MLRVFGQNGSDKTPTARRSGFADQTYDAQSFSASSGSGGGGGFLISALGEYSLVTAEGGSHASFYAGTVDPGSVDVDDSGTTSRFEVENEQGGNSVDFVKWNVREVEGGEATASHGFRLDEARASFSTKGDVTTTPEDGRQENLSWKQYAFASVWLVSGGTGGDVSLKQSAWAKANGAIRDSQAPPPPAVQPASTGGGPSAAAAPASSGPEVTIIKSESGETLSYTFSDDGRWFDLIYDAGDNVIGWESEEWAWSSTKSDDGPAEDWEFSFYESHKELDDRDVDQTSFHYWEETTEANGSYALQENQFDETTETFSELLETKVTDTDDYTESYTIGGESEGGKVKVTLSRTSDVGHSTVTTTKNPRSLDSVASIEDGYVLVDGLYWTYPDLIHVYHFGFSSHRSDAQPSFEVPIQKTEEIVTRTTHSDYTASHKVDAEGRVSEGEVNANHSLVTEDYKRESADIDFVDSSPSYGTDTRRASGFVASGDRKVKTITEQGAYGDAPGGRITSGSWVINTRDEEFFDRDVDAYSKQEFTNGNTSHSDSSHYEHRSLAVGSNEEGGFEDGVSTSTLKTFVTQTDNQNDYQKFGTINSSGNDSSQTVQVDYSWTATAEAGKTPVNPDFAFTQTVDGVVSDLSGSRAAPGIGANLIDTRTPSSDAYISPSISQRAQQQLPSNEEVFRKTLLKELDNRFNGGLGQRALDELKKAGVTADDLKHDANKLARHVAGRDTLPYADKEGLRTLQKLAGGDDASTLDTFQSLLDVVGLIPGIGEPADLLNAAIYEARGQHVDAALSAAGAVPFLGWLATGGKVSRKLAQELAEEAVEGSAKYADEAVEFLDAKKVEIEAPSTEKGGLNLYKWEDEATRLRSEGWREGDRFLHLPNQAKPGQTAKEAAQANWKQNAGRLREAMSEGKPIFDTYVDEAGQLIKAKGFLNAERALLQERGWEFSPSHGAWLPPKN